MPCLAPCICDTYVAVFQASNLFSFNEGPIKIEIYIILTTIPPELEWNTCENETNNISAPTQNKTIAQTIIITALTEKYNIYYPTYVTIVQTSRLPRKQRQLKKHNPPTKQSM